jgi:hypothetical protein
MSFRHTSASSSNINPYDESGASGSSGPTPWQASSGASRSDQLASASVNYSHNSDNRNNIWNAVFFSNEYDYTSIGFGGGFTKLFNEKNTEISVKANAYLDQWRPIYIELREYAQYRPVFRIPDTFQAFLYSIKMVLDRKPIYQLL